MKEWVLADCPLCGSRSNKEKFNKRDRRIVRCTHCSFLFRNPRPLIPFDETNSETYYRKEYLDVADSHKKLFEENFNEFLSHSEPGAILDIGCATGQFLEIAQERGWQATGIDISKWACNYLINRGFKSIHHGTLEEANFSDALFDAVHMSHVLEHVPTPVDFMNEIHRILKPGGRVIIEVPNETLFPYNYMLINLVRPKNLPPRQTALHHLSLFSPATLSRLLNITAFTPVILRSEGFASEHRISTPVFREETTLVRIALLLCRFRIDVRLGFGRYIVAVAQKSSKFPKDIP